MTKFLVGIKVADAVHTWQYADKARRAAIGSNGTLSSSQRHKRELNRKMIGAYRDSKIANSATAIRGDISQFTKDQRKKLLSHREDSVDSSHPRAATTQKERPTPNPSVYRPKL